SLPATPTSAISTLSLHDALPIWAFAAARRLQQRTGDSTRRPGRGGRTGCGRTWRHRLEKRSAGIAAGPGGECRRPRVLRFRPLRSEEHTSELQSLAYLVCRLLLE